MSLGVAAQLVRHIERERDARVAVLKRRAAVALREYKQRRGIATNPSVSHAEAQRIIRNWRGVGLQRGNKLLARDGRLYVKEPGRRTLRQVGTVPRYRGPVRTTRIRRD